MAKKLTIIIVTFLLLCTSTLLAADIAIIKSNDLSPYNQAIAGFSKIIKDNTKEYNLDGEISNTDAVFKQVKKQAPKLIFALGALATVTATEYFPDIPVVYTIVLNPKDKSLITKNNTTGISIQVSPYTQISKLKQTVPHLKSIGALYSPLTENIIEDAKKCCNNLGLQLLAIKINKQEEVPTQAKTLLSSVDALWLLPDSIVLNKESLHYLLMMTLENQIPFLVYNKNFVKAGALISPVINYTEIGKQSGELVKSMLKGNLPKHKLIPPQNVDWAINLHIADNMQLKIPKETLKSFKYIFE